LTGAGGTRRRPIALGDVIDGGRTRPRSGQESGLGALGRKRAVARRGRPRPIALGVALTIVVKRR
jgi:hypothetical protein